MPTKQIELKELPTANDLAKELESIRNAIRQIKDQNLTQVRLSFSGTGRSGNKSIGFRSTSAVRELRNWLEEREKRTIQELRNLGIKV